ncbi:MAG: hypothetical protein K2W82_19560 [Candidatus Obscuribacterales bacterium]|nr:hypothetical protein [Candidatus Obscuribacterales bacterium]
MTRSKPSVFVREKISALLALTLFISGQTAAWCQDTSPAPEQATASAADTNTTSDGTANLKFTPNQGADDSKKLAQVSPASEEATPSNLESEPTDPTAIAQAQGGSVMKRLDPAYNKLPITRGTVNIRKQFKLFAREELIHNLSFRDTNVREVIGELARRGNLNILLDKSVVGKVTGDLHDVTLNEAMDSILASAGLQSRVLDNNTVIVGTPNAMTSLGLNRQMARVFKLSYASAFEVANLLHTSVFNRGILPDFQSSVKTRSSNNSMENPKIGTQERVEKDAAGVKADAREERSLVRESKEEVDTGTDYSFSTRIDTQRNLKGTQRTQVQEGTGFNNAAQDPGTQQIRAYQDINTDYIVEQNGGGAIAVPDARNRQVIVIGTPDDLQVAEECIRLLDRRPRQVHIQVSLVELTNSGIRQLGAHLNLQGQGMSGTVLGGSGAPLINMLPGLGSDGTQTTQTIVQEFAGSILPPALTSFTRTGTTTNNLPTPNTAIAPSTGFNGLLGNFFPASVLPNVAGIAPVQNSRSAFNFLTLGKSAGGRANIATVPAGLNLSVDLLLQTDKAKLLANPSVVVSDNTEALVTLATEVIHKVTSTVSLGVTNVNVELTKAGIFLDVMPRITEDGFITLRIRPQVSAPAGPRQTFANEQVIVTLLNIREIMAQEIRVKDGQTLSLGGLFTEQEVSQISKVPYLAETPLFGALFRSTVKGRTRTELILMITPKIVEEQPGSSPLADSTPQPAAM